MGKKMPLTLAAHGNNVPLTIVVRMSSLQMAKKIIGAIQLTLLNGVNPRTIQGIKSGKSATAQETPSNLWVPWNPGGEWLL